VTGRRRKAVDAPVEDDFQGGEIRLQAIDHLVAQRRHLAVFLGAEALEPGLAGVDGEASAARRRHPGDEVLQVGVGIALVDADPGLDRHRQVRRRGHRRHRVRDQVGFRHQAGPEAGLLHPVAGAADVQVDLIVAVVPGGLGRLAKRHRVRPAHLQRHRMLAGVEGQIARAVAMGDRPSRDHLGIEQGAARDEAQEHPAMPVSPVHHGGHGEATDYLGGHGSGSFGSLKDSKYHGTLRKAHDP
jgi:hypothetical protein